MTRSHDRRWFSHHCNRLSRCLSTAVLTLGLISGTPLGIDLSQSGVVVARQEEPTAPPTPLTIEDSTPQPPDPSTPGATASPEIGGRPSASSLPSPAPSVPSDLPAPQRPGGATPIAAETPTTEPSPQPAPPTGPRRPEPPVGTDEWIDTFTDPSAGLLGETPPEEERLRGRYAGGEYVMEIADPEVAADLLAPIRTPPLADVRIMTEARLEGELTGRYITAVCREVSALGGYRVYLSPGDGYFAITRFVPGEVPTILQEGFHRVLNVGNDPFWFTFSCTAAMLELAINGQVIGMVADNAYASGNTSIGTGYFVGAPPGPVIAHFTELIIQGSEVPVTAAPSHEASVGMEFPPAVSSGALAAPH